MSDKKQEQVVKLEEKVQVFGTKASKYLKTGEPYKVHPIKAEKLIQKGHAVKDKKDVNKNKPANTDV